MCTISAVSETSKIMCNIKENSSGGILDPGALPFHLCSMLLFVIAFITFGKDGALKRRLINFTAVAGVLGSVCAILIPTNGTDFLTLPAYQCFVYHSGLLWFAVYLIISKKASLGLRAYIGNIVLLLSLVLAMIYINSILSVYDTNFMFLVHPPMDGLPFLTLKHGWLVYFMHLVSLGLFLITLLHLPFIITEEKRKRKAKRA